VQNLLMFSGFPVETLSAKILIVGARVGNFAAPICARVFADRFA
jgi:hypothetical protein